MKRTTTYSTLAGAAMLALLPWSSASSQPPVTNNTQTFTFATNTVVTDVPVETRTRQYQVRVLGVLQSRSAGNTVTTFERVVEEDVQLVNTQEALNEARTSLETRAAGQSLEIRPAELSTSAVNTASQTGAAVETGRVITETVLVTETLGPATILVGFLDTGGTPYFVEPGTSNVDETYRTNVAITREIRTTTNTTKAAEYRVVGLVD